jgi:hypothetical protein
MSRTEVRPGKGSPLWNSPFLLREYRYEIGWSYITIRRQAIRFLIYPFAFVDSLTGGQRLSVSRGNHLAVVFLG